MARRPRWIRNAIKVPSRPRGWNLWRTIRTRRKRGTKQYPRQTRRHKRRNRRPIQLRKRGNKSKRKSIKRANIGGQRCHRDQRGLTILLAGKSVTALLSIDTAKFAFPLAGKSVTAFLSVDTAKFAFPNTTRVKPNGRHSLNNVSLSQRRGLPTSSPKAH
jgi:hypothetical protein